VQPEGAKADLIPGNCRGKVHQRASLGYTGRRCLVSRNWSNKTLTDHRLDGQEWFRAVTAGLLDDQVPSENDKHRYIYELAPPDDRDVASLSDRIFRSIAARTRARLAIQAARDRERPQDVPATPAMAEAADREEKDVTAFTRHGADIRRQNLREAPLWTDS
jgi:hypothetical protein